jgi:hypothetical protein
MIVSGRSFAALLKRLGVRYSVPKAEAQVTLFSVSFEKTTGV